MVESKSSHVTLQGLTPIGLRIVVEFAYTGSIDLNLENLEEVNTLLCPGYNKTVHAFPVINHHAVTIFKVCDFLLFILVIYLVSNFCHWNLNIKTRWNL